MTEFPTPCQSPLLASLQLHANGLTVFAFRSAPTKQFRQTRSKKPSRCQKRPVRGPEGRPTTQPGIHTVVRFQLPSARLQSAPTELCPPFGPCPYENQLLQVESAPPAIVGAAVIALKTMTAKNTHTPIEHLRISFMMKSFVRKLKNENLKVDNRSRSPIQRRCIFKSGPLAGTSGFQFKDCTLLNFSHILGAELQ
jgi:hypothetical protein